MSEVACPHCGRLGNVPKSKINTRLNCKICHMTFHVSESGRAVRGEPPVQVAPEPKQGLFQGLLGGQGQAKPASGSTATPDSPESKGGGGLPIRLILISAVGVIAAVFLVSQFMPTKSDVEGSRLRALALELLQAVADDNRGKVKSLVVPTTEDAAGRWFDGVRPLVAEIQKARGPEALQTTAMVTRESVESRAATVTGAFFLKERNDREKAIAEANHEPVPKVSHVEVQLNFGLSDGGEWQLEGRETLAEKPRSQ